MLFDMGAAFNIKIFEGDGKTDFERYALPDKLKRLLVQEFGGTKESMPKNYQAFLDFLHKRVIRS